MERVKTAPAPEPSKPSTEASHRQEQQSAVAAPTTSQERVDDLERRLNVLDSTLGVVDDDDKESGNTETANAATNDHVPSVSVFSDAKEAVNNEPLQKLQENTPSEQLEAKVEPTKPVVESPPKIEPPAEKKPAAVGTGKNNPLLVRCTLYLATAFFV